MHYERGSRFGSYYFHVNDGHYYHRDRMRNGTSYFRCIVAYSHGCPARGILREDLQAFEVSVPHNHLPNINFAEMRRERQRLLDEAASLTHASTYEVFLSPRNMNLHYQNMFTFRNLGPAMERARLSSYPECPTIMALADILSTDRFRCISATFEFADNLYQGAAGASSILFISNRCLEFLRLATFFYCYTMPFKLQGSDLEFQVHCVGTVWDDCRMPLAWILLDGSQNALIAGLTLLRAKLRTWQCQSVICMDDTVEAEAYCSVFGVEVRFSLNNFITDIVKKSKQLITHNDMRDNVLLRTTLEFCCVLPMLPQDLSFQGCGFLRDDALRDCDHHPGVNALLQYILIEWLQNPRRGHIFSVCGNVVRTTSACEETLQSMQQKFAAMGSGSNIYRIIKYLVQIEEVCYGDITKVFKGERSQMTRRSVPLSNDSEIVVLTKALINPMFSIKSGIMNLLRKASSKLYHIIDRELLNEPTT